MIALKNIKKLPTKQNTKIFKIKRSLTLLDNFKLWSQLLSISSLKGAATDMGYFARSKFSRSLVHKKNFSLIGQVVFKVGYVF